MKIMEQCTLVIMVVMLCLSIAGTLYGQDKDYIEHTVTQGETLWGISAKEIADPFLWPKIWKENPDIKNPDLIYPSQKVRIPLELLQKEEVPKSAEAVSPVSTPAVNGKAKPVQTVEEPSRKAVAAAGREYLVDRTTLISSGYIAESIPHKGEVIGAPSERADLAMGDYAYIHTTDPVAKGQKFYVLRSSGKVRHPQTGDPMGYLIDVVGVVEVVGEESGQIMVKINESYSDVDVGDLLDDYVEVDQPFLTGEPGLPAVKGFIVAGKKNREQNAQQFIVYIDKGRRDGMAVGDIVGMLSRNRYDVPNGVVQVISMREKTSTAIIRQSWHEVRPGDLIVPVR